VMIVLLHRCNPGLWSAVALHQSFVRISGVFVVEGIVDSRVLMWVLTVMRTGCDIVDNYDLRCAISSDNMEAFDA
jgi:hypothetical protein